MEAGSDMVDIHVSTIFQSINRESKYLRIEASGEHKKTCMFMLVDSYCKTRTQTHTHAMDKCQIFWTQDYELPYQNLAMDDASDKNVQELEVRGKCLLDESVKRVNLETGLAEPVGDGVTNRGALIEFAKILSEEKKTRIQSFAVHLVELHHQFCWLLFTHKTEAQNKASLVVLCQSN
ncbi:hypothetical protein AMTR_s00024p00230330 [Amborella trichopoda]|uniref:Uncharacterized protein n=1 Tax=Amborella trichopoda TaxID=13333 RepID=W1PU82_AMBTC|nr:hypothetical protein AMTR_s00024p00230330 [Amborella trichopoda]